MNLHGIQIDVVTGAAVLAAGAVHGGQGLVEAHHPTGDVAALALHHWGGIVVGLVGVLHALNAHCIVAVRDDVGCSQCGDHGVFVAQGEGHVKEVVLIIDSVSTVEHAGLRK